MQFNFLNALWEVSERHHSLLYDDETQASQQWRHIKKKNQGSTGDMIQSNHWTSARKSTMGVSHRGNVLVLKLLVFFTAAMVISMPFLVSFTTIAEQEISTLEKYLLTSKVSGSSSTTSNANDPVLFHPTLEDPSHDSPYTILHTVTTRFMVGQAPNATQNDSKQFDIQKARYLLFETFCWPTMKYQNSVNFYWLVLVDPGLDPGIIRDMKALLGNKKHFPAQNAFLVLTNNTQWSSDGVGLENSTSYAVGLQPVAQEFKEGTLDVITGNTDHLLHALDAMNGSKKATKNGLQSSNKPLLVIETLLDADDGLNNGAVEWIQKKAIERTKQHWSEKQKQLTNSVGLQQSSPSRSPSLNTTWWFLCGTDHIEWHNREIFQLTEEKYAKSGITSGIAGLRQSPLFCTSAGFTRVGITMPPDNPAIANYSHMVFPKDGYSNHALTFYFPECTPSNDTITPNGNYSACWHREFAEKIYIVKSRTITSDSMDHLNVGRMKDYRDISWLNASDYPLLINDTEKMWGILQTEFSIDRKKAWEASAFMFEHRQSIIQQNKDSRCAPGFPCWKTAKKNLLKMQKYWGKQRAREREKKKNGLVEKEMKNDGEKQSHEIGKTHTTERNPRNAAEVLGKDHS